ncbi:hypothetical protein ENBRE01_2570 [Enteropsectra breve]|nr:hypothetical protein ENBRE01_2570 [Enteropsectra breve]
MHIVNLLLQGIFAAEQALNQQPLPDDKTMDDYLEKNRMEVEKAKRSNAQFVKLVRPLPNKKVLFSKQELTEYLTKKGKELDSVECATCFNPFFKEDSSDISFKERVIKTDSLLPFCLICPNSKCQNNITCRTCAQSLIKTRFLKDTMKYISWDGKEEISPEKMVPCTHCSYSLLTQLHELNEIPKGTKVDNYVSLKYLEELADGELGPYILLEATKFLNRDFSPNMWNTYFNVINNLSSFDASQKLLIDNLRKQYDFYTACTTERLDFATRVTYIKNFIKTCTVNIDYAFVGQLKGIIISENLPLDAIAMHIMDICSVVPIKHTERFSFLFYILLAGYIEKSKNANTNRSFIKNMMLSKYSFISPDLNVVRQLWITHQKVFTIPPLPNFTLAL